jgi:hypothetical protein
MLDQFHLLTGPELAQAQKYNIKIITQTTQKKNKFNKITQYKIVWNAATLNNYCLK